MKNTFVRKLARLQAIYNKVPIVACKGLCHESCCAVPVTGFELKVLERAAGRAIHTVDRIAGRDCPDGHRIVAPSMFELACPLLVEKRCSVYDSRPLICRVFGVADGLPCPHGCEPTVTLTDEQVFSLIEKIAKIE